MKDRKKLSVVDRPAETSSRYPFPYPYGWFQVSFSNELKKGQVKNIHYFGRDWVLWRDMAGIAHVSDPICPHLGTHLGHGGTVEGNLLVCPYHGWKFAPSGELAEVPWSPCFKRKLILKQYEVCERNELIWLWYHPAERPPEWELPEVPQYHEPNYLGPLQPTWTIKTCWQEMTENESDLSHFALTHQEAYPCIMDRFELDGHTMKVLRLHWHRLPTGVVPIEIEQDNYGPGMVATKFRSPQVRDCLVSGITPIDLETVSLRGNLKYHKPRWRDRILARLILRKSMRTLIGEAVVRQLDEDIEIWENKQYFERPPLAPEYDRFIPKLRKWCHQFYYEWQQEDGNESSDRSDLRVLVRS